MELEYIELLEEFSESIAAAREGLDGGASRSLLQRQSSIRNGFSINDIPEHQLPNPTLDFLQALDNLIEALYKHKVFLGLTPSLAHALEVLTEVQDDDETIRKMKCLVHLMIHTVDNYQRHECTEIRYATLLELILSFGSDWTPSETLNILWEELNLQVESDCEAQDFRRVAYNVLVTLPYLPPSCELFEACGYDTDETMHPMLPECLTQRLDNDPLLRTDRVQQIINHVNDEDEDNHDKDAFTIAITYEPDDGSLSESNGDGMGKTTLAALLAAHPSLTGNYAIVWIELTTAKEGAPLSHSQYMEALQSICKQMGVEPNWPEGIHRLEEESLRRKREKEHMVRVKSQMIKLVRAHSSCILLVLDGIQDEKDYEWFRFVETQSTIVVTKANYIPRATYTVEMEGLGHDEALALLAKEASQDRDHAVFQTTEAFTIVTQCLYHPLIIRTVGRWLQLKQITSGLSKSIEELNLELSVLRHHAALKEQQVPKILGEIINMMLSPATRQGGTPSKVMKLCLSSVAVVFANTTVPLDSVLCLWSQVLTTNPDAVQEMGGDIAPEELHKRLWFLSETFIHLGLLSIMEAGSIVLVKLHHELYAHCGDYMVLDLKYPGTSIEETKGRWHGCYVKGYNQRIKVLKTMHVDDHSRAYAMEKIISHMVEAKSIPKVIDMLKDERFCRERLKLFGYLPATRYHVKDCLLLRERAIASKSASLVETRKVVLTCLKKFAAILSEDSVNLRDNVRIEKAKALHLVGFTQASNHGFSEALTQYKNAMQVMPNPGHSFNAVIMHSQAVLQLTRNDHDKALKKIKGCQKVLKDCGSQETNPAPLLLPELMQLKGDALAAACDYLGAETSYEEALEQATSESKIETGTALFRRARLHQTMGELDQAASALTECIKWKSKIGETDTLNLASAHSVIGDLHSELGDNKKALMHYEKALGILRGMREEVEEADALVLKGKISILQDNGDVGTDVFDAARKAILKAPKMLMDQSAYDLRCLGKIMRERGEERVASEIFEEGLELTKDRPESLERAFILYELGHCLFCFGNNKDTIVCFEEAIKIRKSKLGDCELVLDTQITLGQIYRQLNMHRECLGVSKDVMFLTEKLYKGNDEKAASALFGVAESYEILEEYQQAVAMFEESKETLKRARYGDHPGVANVLQRLGKLHSNHKDLDKAFDCYSEALEICKRLSEEGNPQLGETYYFVGMISRKRGDYENARDYLQESLNIYKELDLPHETCQSLIQLGDVYRLMKEADTAIVSYERCLTYLDAKKTNDSVFGNLFLSFGHARLTRGEINEAMECYDKALKNRIERLGKDHPTTAKAARSLGIVKFALNSYAEAKIYLNDFVRVMETKQTMADVDYIIALQLLGEIYSAEQQFEDAKRLWTKAKMSLENNVIEDEVVPEIEELISTRLEAAESAGQKEKKSLFSRFTELARFEDEQVSREVPIEERIQKVFRSYIFIDDEVL